MVYAREVNDQKLTFCVSGKLWNRSLVMLDLETKSLWSHILGQAMDGELKGTRLEIIPGDMLTWKAWRERHPKSTVLDLSPTRFKSYNADVYRQMQNSQRRPKQFVYGAVVRGSAYHRGWADLMASPTQNLLAGELPVLAMSEKDSTSVRMFDRRIGGKTLTFQADGDQLVDDQGGKWSRRGEALEGPHRGKSLKPVVGLVSFKKAWDVFHPKSQPLTKP